MFRQVLIKFVISCFLVFLISNLGFSQIKSEDKNDYLDADYYYYVEEYDKALNLLLKLQPEYPKHGNVNYLIGACYILGSDDYENALPYLKTAAGDVNFDYRPGDLKYSGAPPDALLYLGDAYQSLNMFIDASKAYHDYQKMVSNDEIAKDVADRRIMGLGLSYEAYLHPPQIQVSKFPGDINTSENEYRPVLSGDNRTLIYTTTKGNTERIYYTQNIQNSWTEPVDITRELGISGGYYTSSLSYDGKSLFLVKQDKTNSDLYMSKLENGVWSRVEPLDKKINSSFNETGAAISTDGTRLYFSSDKPGGYGGIDLYYSAFSKGKWSKPLNLEAPVNTSFDDDSPLISYSGDTLFFSTNGRVSIGKMDIHYTVKNDDGIWNAPVNLGIPYNTADNDYLGMYIVPGGDAFLAQSVPHGSGQSDIVSITKSFPLTENEMKPQTMEGNTPETPLLKPDEDYSGSEISQNTYLSEDLNKSSEPDALSETDDLEVQDINQPVLEKNISESSVAKNMENRSDLYKTKSDIPSENVVYNESPQKTESKNIVENTRNVVQKTSHKTNNIVNGESISDFSADEVYTIQLMALKNYQGNVTFKNLDTEKVKISFGNDGYTRFTYGKYSTIRAAQEQLKKVYNSGHQNAFIKSISLISNYKN